MKAFLSSCALLLFLLGTANAEQADTPAAVPQKSFDQLSSHQYIGLEPDQSRAVQGDAAVLVVYLDDPNSGTSHAELYTSYGTFRVFRQSHSQTLHAGDTLQLACFRQLIVRVVARSAGTDLPASTNSQAATVTFQNSTVHPALSQVQLVQTLGANDASTGPANAVVASYPLNNACGSASTLTVSVALASATRSFSLNLAPAPSADWSVGLSAVMMTQSLKAHLRPNYGAAGSVYALGQSKTFTVDAILSYNNDFGATTTPVGAALAYNMVVGSNFYENKRGIFGFPLRISFLAGVTNLDINHIGNNASGGPNHWFIGLSLNIPTGSSIQTAATPAGTGN